MELTLLIATRLGVWADRRITDGGTTVYRPQSKTCVSHGVVAGFCGELRLCVEAMRTVRAGEVDPHAIAEKCDGLLVVDGEIWEMWSKQARRTPSREAYAVQGSGFCEAQAFLAGAGDCEPATIRRAFRYVARVRTDCGDGCEFKAAPL